ncbi:uncharacterized protein LAESUDRAFT_722683 [Laetiporus sulphureus 93-53]|uniref:AAA+ ATPase domain-containing protein n=1 Tax=Laetiporus sulphureus 93-53 TaxID=1314785 RepID=A0A165G1T2_9APHY|nr:uncharacterized protein LAESUDRAFT_722683 [Laetiporus sulphureus 93-53]KZT09714.1 hypothetical protein LAESUDRAFT_722683 [Laetiporus sulphureus 93-53]
MTEVESSLLFGLPNGLLSGDGSLHATIAPANAESLVFTPNGLLNVPEDTPTILLDEHMGDVDMDLTNSSRDFAFSAPIISATTDFFVPTGLLSDGLGTSAGSLDVCGAWQGSAASESQSQDTEFPDVDELLRPYGNSGPFAAATSSTGSPPNVIRASDLDGKPVYFKRRSKGDHSSESYASSSNATERPFSKLLDMPIHRLLDQLSAETAARLSCQDAEAAVAAAAGPSQANSSADATLWVDRYRPRRFTDLLGDDRVHREVVAWVKEWDYCVFGRNARGRKRPRGDDGENLDEWRRPKEKILLMSGPPGMGKTTLAHVVAKHVGYSVFEINASDARSAQVVEERLKPALETGSAVGSSKPILVVIDEIDGATGGTDSSVGFIQKLIQLTFDKPRKKGRKADLKAARPLLRPIICICNDLYASALTKLRQHARIVRFSRPNDVHLIRRLREICENEGLRAESRALTTLVGVAQGDLRGCLNMLQFIKARGKDVTEPVVRGATMGMKETEASHTSVLNDLFAPMSKKRVNDLGISEAEETRYVSRLCRAVESSGALDKIAQGCFEHYANLHRHDANFSRYLKANVWLTSYDMMSGEMRSEREYALLQYLPYMLVPFYPLFQERGATKVERPKADWESYQVTKTNEEIYKSLSRCLRCATTRCGGDFRHLASDQIMQLELAPLLNRIISPPVKPVNRQVIRPGEKAVLSRLVDLMLALELRFVQEKMEDGQLTYRLDPPIDVFVTYDGKRAADIAVSKYAVRHIVATEIEDRMAALHIDGGEKSKPKKANFFKGTARGRDEDGDSPDADMNTASNKRARKDNEQPKEKIARDFFGRPLKVPASGVDGANTKPINTKSVQQYKIAYRFKEGNSAAVRKPVKVGSFL